MPLFFARIWQLLMTLHEYFGRLDRERLVCYHTRRLVELGVVHPTPSPVSAASGRSLSEDLTSCVAIVASLLVTVDRRIVRAAWSA